MLVALRSGLLASSPFRSAALILLIQSIALYFFTVGYFLTRTELSDISSCQLAGLESRHSIRRHAHSDDGAGQARTLYFRSGEDSTQFIPATVEVASCWPTGTPVYDQVIVIVIDALRFDFLVEHADADGSATGPSHLRRKFDLPYQNRLKSIHHALHARPNHTLIYQLAADAPTVTMQRLKALTTGTLPTFIDISSNFDSARESSRVGDQSPLGTSRVSNFAVDSLLQQLSLLNKTSAFMGDDTWLSIYPRAFSTSFPYPSFNVKDLHTVDRGVTQHLMPVLNSSSPALVVAHFLGVDHVGHRYHAGHSTMKSKLQELNAAIGEVIEYVELAGTQKDILLVVLGDHGMTEDGNHGGSTEDEANSGLFLFSSRKLFDEGSDSLRNYLFHSHLRTSEKLSSSRFVGFRDIPRINQIDILPSLSLLLGTPIPFSNVGEIIPLLFLNGETANLLSGSVPSAAWSVLNAYYLNCLQLYHYMQTYSKRNGGFSSTDLQVLDRLFNDSVSKHENLLARSSITNGRNETSNVEDVYLSIEMYKQFLSKASQLCRDKWTQFSSPHMITGILLLLGLVAVLVTRFVLVGEMYPAPKYEPLTFTNLVVVAVVLFGASVFTPFALTEVFLGYLAVITLHNLSWPIISVGIPHFRFADTCTRIRATLAGWACDTTVVPGVICLLAQYQGLFTNSFILEERSLVSFLLSSCILYVVCGQLCTSAVDLLLRGDSGALCYHIHQFFGSSPFRMLCILSALGFRLTAVFADTSPLHTLTADSFSTWTCFAVFLALLISVTFASWTANNALRSIPRSILHPLQSVLYRVALFIYIPTCATASVIFWLSPSPSTFVVRIICPRLVFVSSIVMLSCSLLSGYVIRQQHSFSFNLPNTWYRSLLFLHYEIILLAFLFPLWLLLGPKSVLITFLAVASSASYLISHSHGGYWRINETRVSGGTGIVQPLSVFRISVYYYFLTQYLFFATGHSASFSSLVPAAAFIGFDEFSYYFAGACLFLNTFANLFLSLPLLSIQLIQFFDGQFGLENDFSNVLLYQIFVHTLRLFCTAVNAYIQRRHLMVWDVFAPKFLFDTVSVLTVTLLITILLVAVPKISKRSS